MNLGIYDLLSRSSYPEGERVAHPYHSSETNGNFMVDEDGETWRCWSTGHECTGNALHLLGIKLGVIECGEWKNGGLSDATWKEIFDAGRAADTDYGIPEPDHTLGNGGDDNATVDAVSDSDGPTWGDIRTALRNANDASERKTARIAGARKLIEERAFRTLETPGEIFVYNSETGIYEPRGEAVIRKRLADVLGSQYSISERREITDSVRSLTSVRDDALGGPPERLCVANGVLELDGDDGPTLTER